MEAGKKEGQKYHEKVTSLSQEELKKADVGPPHTCIALAVCKNLQSTHPEETDELTELQDLIKRLEDANHEEATRTIPHFKIGNTYEEDFKVRYHCRRIQYSSCLSLFFRKEGGEKKGKSGKKKRRGGRREKKEKKK